MTASSKKPKMLVGSCTAGEQTCKGKDRERSTFPMKSTLKRGRSKLKKKKRRAKTFPMKITSLCLPTTLRKG